jgi:protein-L-isoaspartate O-methyltransferase
LTSEVLAAIAAVPRHVFVEEALASRAYEDTALPLGLLADHLAALRGGADDRSAARRA